MIDNYVFFCYVFAGIYLLFIKWLSSGLGKLRVGQNHDIKTVTIIVAARNEEKNLVDCLAALEKQNYPLHLIQYVLVDDRSSDATGKILSRFCEQHPNAIKIEIIDNIENISPKKNALARGIEKAAGEILLFCDADCVPPPGLITEMVRYFEPDVGLVAGFSPLQAQKNEFWPKIFELDSLVNGAVAAASFGHQSGMTCTGRNLAYTRDVYQKIGGFEGLYHSLSGDDDLFLFKLQQKSQKKIRYAIAPESIVPAKTVSGLGDFLQQKRRHISAGKFFPAQIKAYYFLYHFINSLFYANFLLAIFSFRFFIIAGGFLFIKFVGDYLFIKKFAQVINYQAPLNFFLRWEIYYFLLNLLIGPTAFIGKIRWK